MDAPLLGLIDYPCLWRQSALTSISAADAASLIGNFNSMSRARRITRLIGAILLLV
jgi:hypothetical protein